MKILVAKKALEFNTLDILDAKVVEPMNIEELNLFLAESIAFAQTERDLTTPAGLAISVLSDMMHAGLIVIQPETN